MKAFGCVFLGLFIAGIASVPGFAFSDSGEEEVVAGCGGFVLPGKGKNGGVAANPDLSRVSVRILTDSGVLRHTTECAPNGYYFLQVDQPGEYFVEARGEGGWVFQPASVRVTVDRSGVCHGGNDVNFDFAGYSVSGRAEALGANGGGGAKSRGGVAGVTVSLVGEGGKTVVATASTGTDGEYVFPRVFPGSYEVRAEADKTPLWRFGAATAKVTVGAGGEGARVAAPITVAGFQVTGSIVSAGGAGVPGVEVNLEPTDADAKKGSRGTVLSAVTAEDGTFAVAGAAPGTYTVRPKTDQADGAKLVISPDHASVTVVAGPATVAGPPFVVSGFSSRGTVLGVDGKGLSGAKVTFTGRGVSREAKTDASGAFTVTSLPEGGYTVTASADRHTFPTINFSAGPDTREVPSIRAETVSLCGKVEGDGSSGDGNGKVEEHTIVIGKPRGKQMSEIARAVVKDGNAFCVEVPAGTYIVEPVTSPTSAVLSPARREVQVTSGPVDGLTFRVAAVSVSGKVRCPADSNSGKAGKKSAGCDTTIAVTLRRDGATSTGAAGAGRELRTQVAADGSFVFRNVRPGSYALAASHDSLCFRDESLPIKVGTEDVTEGTELVQTGHSLTIFVSHDIEVEIEHESSSSSAAAAETRALTKGANRICLPRGGVYSVVPRSCFRFEHDAYKYDTRAPRILDFEARRFRVSGTVRVRGTGRSVPSSLELRVRRTIDGNPADEQVVTASPRNPSSPSDGAGISIYGYSYWAQVGETLEVVPVSKKLLFYPESRSVTVARRECPGEVEPLEGREGLFITGSVSPPTEGVQVTVLEKSAAGDGSASRVGAAVTAADGTYRVGPLYDDREFVLEAAKQGFHFAETPGKKGHFAALALADLSVSVVDAATGKPIPGVLVSVSGDKGEGGDGVPFRTNRRTPSDGQPLSLDALRPGTMFLKPVSREHSFEPATKSVNLRPGAHEKVVFKAKRVAWGISGIVRGLGGAPMSNVIVRALSPTDGKVAAETETERGTGVFSLRGLRPTPKGGSGYRIVCESPSGGNRGSSSAGVGAANGGGDDDASASTSSAASASASTSGSAYSSSWRAIGERTVAIAGDDVSGVEIVGVALPAGMDILGEVSLVGGADTGASTNGTETASNTIASGSNAAAVLDGLEVRLYASGAQQPMRVVSAPKSRHFQFFGLPRDDYRVVVAQRSGTAGRGVVNPERERTALVPAAGGDGPRKVYVTYGIASGDGAQEISIGSVFGLLVIVAMTFVVVKKDEVEVFVKQWRDRRSDAAQQSSSSSLSAGQRSRSQKGSSNGRR